ncbi:Putative pectinesterase/pectinesterase inhibitor 28 [Linum perenne]
MADDDGGKKRFAIIGVSSFLLVAMVIAVTVGVGNQGDDDGGGDIGGDIGPGQTEDIAASKKAITSICQPADFKMSCESSLEKTAGNTSDPRELVKIAFTIAKKSIGEAMVKSETLHQLDNDPRTHEALITCKELMNMSMSELQDCLVKVSQDFDFTKLEPFMADLKTWLSAAMTYQETCLDGFVNVSTKAGAKMKEFMNTSMELTTNGLDIVTGLDTLFTSFQPGDLSAGPGRRLLQDANSLPVLGHGRMPFPTWVPERFRRLLGDNSGDSTGNKDKDKTGNKGTHKEDSDDSTDKEKNKDKDKDEKKDDDQTEEEEKKDDQAKDTKDFTKPAATIADIVVAEDGSGDYKTINEALENLLKEKKKVGTVVVIYIKAGTYKEYIEVSKKLDNLVLIGDGADKTLITGSKNFIDGVSTYHTSTVAVAADYFFAKNLRIENSAGAEKHQAVALRVSADFAVFHNCTFDGYQDTLYTHTKRQFYRDCTISGTIDYIFGDAAVVFQNCIFLIRKPMSNQQCIVTAQGRKQRHQPSAIIIQNGTITAHPDMKDDWKNFKSYLGRPWKNFSRTVIMESYIDELISPDGWLPWMGTVGLKTCWYGEYGNYGPGADKSKRVTWLGIKKITPQHAVDFTPERFIRSDTWVKPTGIPYISYMVKPSTSRRVETELITEG